MKNKKIDEIRDRCREDNNWSYINPTVFNAYSDWLEKELIKAEQPVKNLTIPVVSGSFCEYSECSKDKRLFTSSCGSDYPKEDKHGHRLKDAFVWCRNCGKVINYR